MSARSSTQKFQAVLYVAYSLGHRLVRGVKRRVTSIGLMVLLGLPLIGGLTVMYVRGALFQLVSVFVAGVLVAFWMAIFRSASLKVEREVPRIGSVGDKVIYTVRYENTGRRTLRNFLLEDLAPDPRPSKDLFLETREPGEELRNGFDRLFVAYRWMWLVDRRLLFEGSVEAGVTLKPGERGQAQMSMIPRRRGVVELRDMRVLLPEPFGIFQRARKVKQKKAHLVVLPKRYRVPSLRLPGSSRNHVGGEAMSLSSGHAGEFVGLREYRPGDPLRHIHWPSWARLGKPIVKEYEEVFFPRYGLFLDTAIPGEREVLFEGAVSVAASFACAVDTQECLLDLIFMQQGAKTLTVGRGVAKIENMLEVLAGVEPDLEPDWGELRDMVMLHGEGLTACMVVLSHWSEERRDLLRFWRANGLELLVFYLCETEESGRSELRYDAGDVRFIPKDRIAEVLANLG